MNPELIEAEAGADQMIHTNPADKGFNTSTHAKLVTMTPSQS